MDGRATLEPHVYETSSLAYRGLAVEGEDQSILVSGESGAGKTETVKILLSDLASVRRGRQHLNAVAEQRRRHHDDDDNTDTAFQSPIVQRVLDSNPLLEAFGNARLFATTILHDLESTFSCSLIRKIRRLPLALAAPFPLVSRRVANVKCTCWKNHGFA